MDVLSVDRSSWDQSFIDSDVTSRQSPHCSSPSIVVDERLLSVSGNVRCQRRAICAPGPDTISASTIQREFRQIANNRSKSVPFYRNITVAECCNNSHQLISGQDMLKCSPLESPSPSSHSSAASCVQVNRTPHDVKSCSTLTSPNSLSLVELEQLSQLTPKTSHHPEINCFGTQSFGVPLVNEVENCSQTRKSPPTIPVPSRAIKYPSAAVCQSSTLPSFFEVNSRIPSSFVDEKQNVFGDRSDTKIDASVSIPPSAYSLVTSFLPVWDVDRLELVYRRLAISGFYVGRVSVDEAASRLSRWPVGSFMLRDSSDKRYQFAVSVQTPRGPTSVRMAYRSGLFRLDCHVDQEHRMPTFDCALRLVCHYVGLSRRAASRHGNDSLASPGVSTVTSPVSHGYVLLEATGRRDTPVLLRTAYREHPSCLSHLCRLSVNRAILVAGRHDASGVVPAAAIDRLHLLPSFKTYLKDYPYDI